MRFRTGVASSTEAGPHGWSGRGPVTASPVSCASRSSANCSWSAPSVGLSLDSSKVRSTVPPATVGPEKALTNPSCPATTSVSEAGSPVTGRPSPVAVTSLVVFRKVPPEVRVAGTSTSTVKVQLPLAGRVPLVRVIVSVPLTCEPAPHTSSAGSPWATRPDVTASRSSVKVMPVSEPVSSRLLRVNSSPIVSPARTG